MEQTEYNILGIKIPAPVLNKLIGFSLVFLILAYLFIGFWGTDTLGSFFQRNYYKTQYYVFLEPENSSSKNYHVVADITKSTWSEGSDEYSASGDSYYLNKIYWPNKGYSTFEECDIYDTVVNQKPSNCFTDDGVFYKVRLGEKVK